MDSSTIDLYHPKHPFWFSWTIVFVYIPCLLRVVDLSLRDLLLRFVLHRFDAVTPYERHGMLKLTGQLALPGCLEGMTLTGWSWRGVVGAVMNIFLRLLFILFMPVLINLRQFRQGEFHDQGDNVRKKILLINTTY
jgi:hypothetical protein